MLKIRLKIHEIYRFILSGSFNAVTTYCLYLLLLKIFHYQLAYSLTYAAGILLAYWLNTRFVFRADHNWIKLLIYPTIYLIQYALSFSLLWLFVEKCKLSPVYAPIIILFLITPLSFLLNRYVITSMRFRAKD